MKRRALTRSRRTGTKVLRRENYTLKTSLKKYTWFNLEFDAWSGSQSLQPVCEKDSRSKRPKRPRKQRAVEHKESSDYDGPKPCSLSEGKEAHDHKVIERFPRLQEISKPIDILISFGYDFFSPPQKSTLTELLTISMTT